MKHEGGASTDGSAGAPASETQGSGGPRRHVLTAAEVVALHARLLDDICVSAGPCTGREEGGLNPLIDVQPAQPGADPALAARVTLADVARFLPAAGALHVEPDGWAVVGVPANFWVEVRPAVVRAELLGEQADVRFTPVGYRWSYGDGATRTTRVAGASWADLGQDELTATPTGHRYAARGRVEATVTVYFDAEYRVAGGDWIAVAGAVAADSPATPILVVTERTVLTNG